MKLFLICLSFSLSVCSTDGPSEAAQESSRENQRERSEVIYGCGVPKNPGSYQAVMNEEEIERHYSPVPTDWKLCGKGAGNNDENVVEALLETGIFFRDEQGHFYSEQFDQKGKPIDFVDGYPVKELPDGSWELLNLDGDRHTKDMYFRQQAYLIWRALRDKKRVFVEGSSDLKGIAETRHEEGTRKELSQLRKRNRSNSQGSSQEQCSQPRAEPQSTSSRYWDNY